ncbi:O-antigen ligase family protein [Cryobacterium serini]|nr:O-antigen ligase family protein [Cryobacterium serini]
MTVSLVVLALESLLYPSQNNVPTGLFSLEIRGLNLRVPDVAALGIFLVGLFSARAETPRLVPYFVTLGIAVLYVAITAAVNSADGMGLGTIFTQSRFLFYSLLFLPVIGTVSGVALLKVGNDALKWVAVPAFGTVLVWISGQSAFQVPGFPGSSYGPVGADAGTIIGFLALCAVGHAAMQGKVTLSTLWLLLPLIGGQRASIVATTVIGLVGVAIILGRKDVLTEEKRRKIRRRSLGAAVLALVGSSLLIIAGSTMPAFQRLIGAVTATFTSEGKVASADTRPYLIQQSWEIIQQSPLIGHGFGKTVNFYDIYRMAFIETGSAHNFIADILIRGGLVGGLISLCLVIAAFSATRPWGIDRLFWVVILMTLLGKAMLEPAFDKYRLVFLLALALTGVLISSRQKNKKQSILPGRASESAQ